MISSADLSFMADFVFPALCAFTRAEISAIFSASSKKESPLGLGFSKTSTEIEFAFTTKRCSMKAFKLLPCEAADVRDAHSNQHIFPFFL